MDRLKPIESFVAVVAKGSLTAAANAQGVAPAVIGRRIGALEKRPGIELLPRTTHCISLAHESSAFLEDCQRVLTDLANAEASVGAGGVKASGPLRIRAPAGFGRRHVAPRVPKFIATHHRRLCLATPEYPKRTAAPQHPNELSRHEYLTLSSDASQTRGWASAVDDEIVHRRPRGRCDCSDGQVLHGCCLSGFEIAWRSTWELEDKIANGRLTSVLDSFAVPRNGIHAVFPHARHVPLRVRLGIDFLKQTYVDAGDWCAAPTH